MARKKNEDIEMTTTGVSKKSGIITTIVLTLLSVAFVYPIILVVINSFKSKLFISDQPFALPNDQSFVCLKNYID